jgi:hypothetical protein
MDIRSKKPPAIISFESGTLESQLGEILASCWVPQPSKRPLAVSLISTLSSMIDSAYLQETQVPGGHTDGDTITEPRETVQEGDRQALVLAASQPLNPSIRVQPRRVLEEQESHVKLQTIYLRRDEIDRYPIENDDIFRDMRPFYHFLRSFSRPFSGNRNYVLSAPGAALEPEMVSLENPVGPAQSDEDGSGGHVLASIPSPPEDMPESSRRIRYRVPTDIFTNPPDPVRHQLYHQIRKQRWFHRKRTETTLTAAESKRLPGSQQGESVL